MHAGGTAVCSLCKLCCTCKAASPHRHAPAQGTVENAVAAARTADPASQARPVQCFPLLPVCTRLRFTSAVPVQVQLLPPARRALRGPSLLLGLGPQSGPSAGLAHALVLEKGCAASGAHLNAQAANGCTVVAQSLEAQVSPKLHPMHWLGAGHKLRKWHRSVMLARLAAAEAFAPTALARVLPSCCQGTSSDRVPHGWQCASGPMSEQQDLRKTPECATAFHRWHQGAMWRELLAFSCRC